MRTNKHFGHIRHLPGLGKLPFHGLPLYIYTVLSPENISCSFSTWPSVAPPLRPTINVLLFVKPFILQWTTKSPVLYFESWLPSRGPCTKGLVPSKTLPWKVVEHLRGGLSGGNTNHWGVPSKALVRPLPLYSFCPWSEQFCSAVHCYLNWLSWSRHGAMGPTDPTGTCKAMSQNKASLCINWLSHIFHHSDNSWIMHMFL